MSLEDDLMKRFGNLSEKKLFLSLGDEAIESGIVTKLISSAQVRVEGAAFDNRKYVLKYDEVMRQQREIMYKQRDDILGYENPKEIIVKLLRKTAQYVVDNSVYYQDGDPVVDYTKLNELLNKMLRINLIVNEEDYKDKSKEENIDMLANTLKVMLENKHKEIPEEHLNELLRRIAISIVDKYWTQHIDSMYKLRDGVNYVSYAQRDPLNVYINEGYNKFQDMANKIALETSMYTLNMEVQKAEASRV